MRVLPAAAVVSIALHGAAIAWVRLGPIDAKRVPAVAPPRLEIVPQRLADPEPVVVALLDDNTVVAPAHPTPANKSTTGPKLAASTRVATETHIAPPVTSTATEPVHRNPLMTMRDPARPSIDQVPSKAFLDHFLATSRPLQPKEIAGQALQDELANAEGQLHNARWIANASPDQVTSARETAVALRDELANRELQPDGPGTKSDHDTFRIRYAPDGSATIRDKRNLRVKTWFPVIAGTFDVSDWQMRKHGIDPYASYKLKVLDETRDERFEIGKRYRTQQLAHSGEYMQKNIERLWALTHDPGERKQGLFELWDDCAETGSDEVVAGGKSARAYLVGFIRSRLPVGSADAFKAEELARFNGRRRSHETFAPY